MFPEMTEASSTYFNEFCVKINNEMPPVLRGMSPVARIRDNEINDYTSMSFKLLNYTFISLMNTFLIY